jgi:3-dehydroquinate synthetase
VEVVKRVYPKPPAMPDAADAWEIMRHDKKIRGGRPAFILIEAPGRPVIVHDLQKKELAAAVDAARRAYGQQLW